jgi:hypothetical protein
MVRPCSFGTVIYRKLHKKAKKERTMPVVPLSMTGTWLAR